MRWTLEAERWLREIHDHIAEDNPEAAIRTVRGIFERAQTLASFPERGYRYSNSSKRHIRVLLYGHFQAVPSLLGNPSAHRESPLGDREWSRVDRDR